VTDEHLSLDELAELDEGLLTPERASAVRAHLDDCAQCHAAAAAITSTRSMLAGLPAEPMPDAVKARIDQALSDASPQSTATVVPQLETYRRRRFGLPTAAATSAAAAIVLVIGAIVVAAVHHPHSGENAGAAAPGAGAFSTAVPQQPKDYKRTSTGIDYTPALLLSDIPGLVATVPGFGPARTPAASSPAGITPQASGTTDGSLEKQPVPKVLQPLYNSHAKLLACAARLSSIPNAVPLAIDFGRWTNGDFHSAPSIILILRDPNPEVVDVYVTGPTCSGNAEIRTLTKVPLQ
jgi:hypothetical protein